MLRFSLRRAKIYKPGKGPKRPESALTPQSESENSAQNEIQNIEKDEMNKLVSKIKNKNKDGEYLPADPHVMDKVYDTTTWEGDFLERMKVVDSKRTIREQTVYDNSSWLDRKKFRYNEIKQAGVFDDENFIAWKDMNKWLNFLIGGSSVVLLSYLTYLYYKHYNNRRLYEYYNSEYDPLKQPTENLVNLINEKVVKKLGYDPEQTNLRFKYIDPANDSVQDKLEVSVFHWIWVLETRISFFILAGYFLDLLGLDFLVLADMGPIFVA